MSKTILKTVLVTLIAALPATAVAHGPQGHSPVGEPGDPARATRTIAVSMTDEMRFIPASIAVKRGETVRFVVKNDGIEPHEFMLGEMKALQDHAEEMRKHPTMVHDEPNAITVLPAQSGELVWHFTTAGRVDFACLIPGHFEKGMQGDIRVSPR
jgi:uncharacterized cupredoxin-like copper-binding protein